MIIDFHAHIYPDKIAAKASKSIGDFYNSPMAHHGYLEELLESGLKNGISKFVVHSAATKPMQVEPVNNFIIEQKTEHPELIGFGTIHPDYSSFTSELERITNAGLKGIKLHPDFQKFQADCAKMDSIYEEIESKNLIVLFHAGDYRFDFSSPARIKNVIKKHPSLKVVAAHFGGYTEWQEAKILLGENVWFDTSSSLWKLSPEEALAMIKKHGVEKFLFGSDFPMWDYEGELERFDRLKLSSSDKDLILYRNALSLLAE